MLFSRLKKGAKKLAQKEETKMPNFIRLEKLTSVPF